MRSCITVLVSHTYCPLHSKPEKKKESRFQIMTICCPNQMKRILRRVSTLNLWQRLNYGFLKLLKSHKSNAALRISPTKSCFFLKASLFMTQSLINSVLRWKGWRSHQLLISGRVVCFRNSKLKSKINWYIQNMCDAQFYHKMTNMFQREFYYNQAA
jgi:hypothetical protein